MKNKQDKYLLDAKDQTVQEYTPRFMSLYTIQTTVFTTRKLTGGNKQQ